MAKHPLGEVFGFPIDSKDKNAIRCWKNKLCPFNNKVPSCTKDKAQNPLGVCTVIDGGRYAITCPVRFRENWLIAEDAASFFFPPDTRWTSLSEIRMNDKNGKTAGNIDLVLVSYNEDGKITDFGAVEVQAVYISGNIRKPFEEFIKDSKRGTKFDWSEEANYPHADYLSSSRKRLVPQLIYKGGILKNWQKKTVVVLHEGFFATLPPVPKVKKEDADVAWMIYSLKESKGRLILYKKETVYTRFEDAIDKIAKPEPGDIKDFITVLQEKLDEKLDAKTEPDTFTLDELFKKSHE